MPQPGFRPLTTLAALALSVAATGAPADKSGCLFSKSAGTMRSEGCSDDPLKLASRPALIKAREFLKIDNVKIQFIGCKDTVFRTEPGTSARGRAYTIYYPILGTSIDDYTGPLTHELAHVFQAQAAGGIGKLKEVMPASSRRELGADFLTGVVFAQASKQSNLRFQTNLDLSGLFNEPTVDAHGTPAQRGDAFRMGRYLKFQEVGNDVGSAHIEFQENRYATITSW